jgi:pyruvate kinase
VNIVDSSLVIEGTLTETDKAYLAAMSDLGLVNIMLSYVERLSDVDEVRALLPDSSIVLKIESQRGLEFVRDVGASRGRLMAARGDLFIEVPQPHRVLRAVRDIIAADPEAIVASRILGSIARDPVAESSDISDVAWLIGLGYRTFMLGDEVCLHRDTVFEALNLLDAIARDELSDS